MTITSNNIRLLEAERMADTDDGGGRRTNNVVPDGVAGNVFPKVSRLDSVYGRVNIRKLYGHVNTATVETYAGAHCIITKAPDNPRIGVLLFSTGSDYHVRRDARDRIESYVIAGPESRMVVYGRQLKGASAVLVYQREDEPLPEVGDVYCLSDETGGVTGAQQFVRVQDLTHELRTFTENNAEFRRRVVTLRIGAPLRVEFKGIGSPSVISSARGNTLLRATTVADASRYYGIQPLASAALKDALEVMVASVYAPIVPTTQREAAVTLASIGGSVALVESGSGIFVDGPFAVPDVGNGVLFTLRTSLAIKPGTLDLRIVSGIGTYVSQDDGQGNVAPVTSGGWSGTVDYASGTLVIALNFTTGFVSYDLQVRYEAVTEVSQAAQTRAELVTLATRGTVYVPTFNPLPSPGTLRVEYRALGRWYALRDRGDGVLEGGDPAYGTGTVDYVTGGGNITLGALPDVGSSIIYTWGTPIHYEKRLADTGGKAFQDFTVAHTPVSPGEFEVEYLSDGTPYTVTTDSNGVLSGGGVTGTINFSTGAVHMEYGTRLPDFDSTLTVSYKSWVLDPSQGIIGDAVTSKPIADPTQIGEAVLPGSVSGILNMYLTVSISDVVFDTTETFVPFKVDAAGVVTSTAEVGFRHDWNSVTVKMPVGTVLGALLNSTGVIVYNTAIVLPTTVYLRAGQPAWDQNAFSSVPHATAASITYTPALYDDGGAGIPADSAARVYTDREDDFTVANDAPIHVDLTRTSTADLVAGSIAFALAGEHFIERNGTLYIRPQYNGSASAAGTIDYVTGIATPTLWTRGAALGLAVQSALIKLGDWVGFSAYFRTAGSPLRPAATYVQATATDGTLLSATSNTDGVIESTYVHGRVEQSMGVVSLLFGEWLTAAGNEGEPWYDPDLVVGSLVLKPKTIQPQTLRYSTVVITSLPLSADILGLDPVRLPSDGRVPIYRPADVDVIHHTGTLDAGTPAAGQEFDVGRDGLESLWLEDANRKKLAGSMYVADLEAGTVEMDAALSLAGYVPPIAIRHRIAEEVLLADVQINGQISLTAPLKRDYPLGSMLSGALLFGDLFARVENVFDQRTWTGVWSDTLIGDQADFEYDDVNYPIEVLNDGAVRERFRISFTSNTGNYQVFGENLGVIATGNISADIAPVDQLTGKTYFVMRKEGWGVVPPPAGAQQRFNTVPAAADFWVARIVLPGASLAGDSFDAHLRGDAD